MAALASPLRSGRPPGGGAEGGWRAHIGLSVPGFAWEFLRRNPGYRADYERWLAAQGHGAVALDTRWGLRFAADPALPVAEADVFWRPDVAPGLVVPLDHRTDGEGGSPMLPLPAGRTRLAEDGLHVRLPAGLQMLLRGRASADGPLVVMLAYDLDLGLRVRAVEALERACRGRPPPRSRLTAAQRTRLAQCLVALDGHLHRDSYRAIAKALFGASAVENEAWRTASIRATTIRLVRAGRALMEGGYLQLLRSGL
jgi:hypothetical protein